MNAREYLGQAWTIQKRIDTTRDELEKVESLLLQGVSFEEKLGSGDNNKNERVIFKILDLQEKLTHQLEDFIDALTEITHTINQIDDANEVTVLYKRYIAFEKFSVIADEMNYSLRQTYRIHDQAVLSVQVIINNGI